MGGAVPEHLLPKSLPVEIAYLWEWFIELNNARSSSGFGGNPITFSEIAAWSQLTGIVTQPWEIKVLRRIDVVYMNIQQQQLKKSPP